MSPTHLSAIPKNDAPDSKNPTKPLNLLQITKNASRTLWMDFFRKDGAGQKSLYTILKENILFCTLNHRELKYLTTLVYERVYQPKEVIFNQNDRGLGMYLIAQGTVSIHSQTTEGDIPVAQLCEGSFFGELALIDPDNLRSASAISLDRSMIIGFFKPDLMELLERKPSMGVKILLQLSTVLGKRLLETTDRIAQLNITPIRRGDSLEKVI